MATALSPEVQLMRRLVRHIHIPDLPPVYAPRSLAPTIRDHIQGQITRQRLLQEDPPVDQADYGFAKVTARVPTSFTSWVKRAGPPPTVLSFTRRPTYILPKHQVERQEPWQVEYLVKSLKSRVDLQFPEPPRWSSLPWRPFWEQGQIESGWKHDPLNHQWPGVGVLIMPCAEAMFLGPGQLSIWPIIDLKDDVQRGRTKLKTKYEFERILEDTTIEILKREFGIQAFAVPGATGVWVESRIPPPEVDVDRTEADGVMSPPDSLDASNRRANVRRIATVHASIADHMTQWGVSLHVGQPSPTIVAELAYMKSSASPLGPSKYLFTHFNHNAVPARAGQGAIPYSLIKADSGRRHPAPLGMDNRDISTAWTYEFARQLGMNDGHVDHYSMVEANDTNTATNLPTNTSGAGFRFNGVFSEDVMNRTYRQVDVPHIMVGRREKVAPGIVENSVRIEHHDGRIDAASHDGWILSWPLWERTLLQKLDEAICGGPCDTRVRVYGLQKQISSRLQRRRNELLQAKKVEEEWRADMPHLVRRPLTDSIIRELADRFREMESILKTVRIESLVFWFGSDL
ncbi:putative lipoate-protein ligase-like protein [Diaporthe ampelina]|uniref:Putative lipoate-protein ligase-like protein n=1 Tax=Diaporthe ampelina TaxID=1214573 RepID=A0A0G2H7N4_9PEZI|nr:putative lipoate-protein ligase-like protein [Diaporthe ampelina]